MIDDRVPMHDRHAGAMGMFHYIRLLGDLGFRVIFIPADRKRIEPYSSDLEQIGVKALYGDFNFEDDVLNQFSSEIHVAWLSRPGPATEYIDLVRSKTKAKILYCGRDLHFLRIKRQAEIEGNDGLLQIAEHQKSIECSLFCKADVVLTFSELEMALISEVSQAARVRLISPYVFDIQAEPKFAARSADIIFVGGFDHQPNLDGAMWFLDSCWTAVKASLPTARFVIIGSNLPACLAEREDRDIVIAGHVKNLSSYFESALGSVAPLRYGAGIKGKIVTSMSLDCPVVCTRIAAEGMGLEDGRNVLIANDAREFAMKLAELHTSEARRRAIVLGGRDYVKSRYSKSAVKEALRAILDDVGVRVTRGR